MYQSIRFFLGTTILLILASCSPSNSLELTVQPQNDSRPFASGGGVISYSYVVTNTGTTSIKDSILITDDKMQAICQNLIEVGNKDQSLDPGESGTCTSTHTVTQADIDSGSVINNSIAKMRGIESNKVRNIVKILQPIQTEGFLSGLTIQHIVVKGEWLIQIARCYGADLGEIRAANPQITETDPAASLNAMILTIPNIGSMGAIYGPPCITFYTVTDGDTWTSIAQRYNANVAVLQKANSNIPVSVGTKIKVPLNSASTAIRGAIAPRIASPKERIALVDEYLKKSYTGDLTYTTPLSMNWDTTSRVVLLLTPSLFGGEVSSQIESDGLVIATITPDTLVTSAGQELKVTSISKILVKPRIKAVLYSADLDAFEIVSNPNENEEKSVGSSMSTEWQWRIKAIKTGPQKIILDIYRLVQFDDVDEWRKVETYIADINVHVTPIQRVQTIDWKWVAGFILALIGSALGVLNWLNNRSKESKIVKPKKDKPVRNTKRAKK